MTFKKSDSVYWNRKLQAYLHDPFDKMFKIPGHEERSAELLEILGEQASNENFWQDADVLASSIERGTVPGFSKNSDKSGAVDFVKFPEITHPTGTESILTFDLPDDATSENIMLELKESLKTFIGTKAGEGGISERFKGNPEEFAVARFFYLHLALRFKLAEKEGSYLGQLWHRLPADSRFPDHSIWNHCQLVSALNSCMDFATEGTGDFKKARRDNIAVSVFSITPVQGFIGKSRKLKDYWSSSILLSYLAFEGIRWVMENLGPDHILYPSLIDQPLVAEYMRKKWHLKGEDEVKFWKNHPKDIATFPNKFVFLMPKNRAGEIESSIKEHIKKEWINICEKVRIYTEKKLTLDKTDYYRELWKRETSDFWDFGFASVKLADLGDKEAIFKLVEESAVKTEIKTAEILKNMSEKLYKNMSENPMLYGLSHSLLQTLLASQKTVRQVKREEEPGEKCQLCGEFEVLHTENCKNKRAAEYAKHVKKDVWGQIKDESDDADFKKNERLCAICTVKRFLSRVMAHETAKNHLLHSVFKGVESFPSTPEIALMDYAENHKDKNIKKLAADLYSGKDVSNISNRDKYYAILVMDGDKMGDLINGKTIAATWKSIMHPELRKKIEGKNDFDAEITKDWKELFKKKSRKMIPSLHASISESLGDFAIYGVAPIIKEHKGKLIYAGGDDVAAVLPIQEVLQAAIEIKDYYTHSFRSIGIDGTSKKVTNKADNRAGKLSAGLGDSSGISISAGILLCHCKEPLSQMITEAHSLLDDIAKNKCDRNACAVKLKKRSGGDRLFAAKWSDSKKWEAFEKFNKAVKKDGDNSVSTALIYRLEKYRDGVEAILKTGNDEMLDKFFAKHLDRSGKGKDLDKLEIGASMKELCIYENSKKEKFFEPERLIVASFLAGGEHE